MSDNSYFGAPAHLRQAQVRCDSIQSDFRAGDTPRPIRREPPPLPAALVPSDDALKLRLSEELEYARRMLDTLGDELAADTGVITRHSVALQSIDIVGQMIGHIANVVRSSDPTGAVERIGMCELKARLQRHRL
ncbi:MAG: hypothetical protein ACR2FK_07590 [Sphingomicrobium sp.]